MSLHALARALEEAAQEQWPEYVWSIGVHPDAEERIAAALDDLHARRESDMRPASAAPAARTVDTHDLNEAA